MRVTSWNVNGIRALDKRGDLDWVWEADHDIVCLQEVKTHPGSLPKRLREPEGWQAFWEPAQRKGYSGVATFVREGIEVRDLPELRDLKDPRFGGEGRVIALDVGAFVLFNIYFPNGRQGDERLQYKLDFYEAFRKCARELVAEGREVAVGGDFNTAHRAVDVWSVAEWEHISTFRPEERAFFDRLEEDGFLDTFRAEAGDREGQFTWWDYLSEARADNRGIRIDYWWVSAGLEDHLVDAWISPHIMGSDHCPVGIELETD